MSAGSVLAATAVVGLPAPALLRGEQRGSVSKLKVVITGGHPGDPEYGCGGTISRLTELGHEAVLLYLNQGEPVESPALMTGHRMEEAKKACEILKARPAHVGQIEIEIIRMGDVLEGALEEFRLGVAGDLANRMIHSQPRPVRGDQGHSDCRIFERALEKRILWQRLNGRAFQEHFGEEKRRC